MKKYVAALLLVLGVSFAYAQYIGIVPAVWRTSAAATSTWTQGDQTNNVFKGVEVNINVSAYTSGNFTPHIQGKDPASGTYYDILVGPAISATGITVLKVGPGIVPLANASAQDVLPGTWRVTMVGASTPSATFTVGGFLFPN